MLPSAEEITDLHGTFGTLFDVQVTPELIEVQTQPSKGKVRYPSATNFIPSAEQATAGQSKIGALVCVQVIPESEETQMPLWLVAATNLFPSADEAIEVQFVMGALVCVQVWANVKLAVSKAVATNTRILKVFITHSANPTYSTAL
jgi:hypothetical protein